MWHTNKTIGSAGTEWTFNEVEVGEDGNCPCDKSKEYIIILSQKTLNQCKTLCKKYPNLEWMAALIGEENKEKGSLYVKELKLFEQKIQGAFVELTDKGNADMAATPNLGWLHSHNKMDVFFSSQDKTTAGMHRLSLVVNNDLKFFGRVCDTLSCGHKTLQKINLQFEVFDDDAIDKEADELIQEETIPTVIGYNSTYGQYQTQSTFERVDSGNSCVWCGKEISNKKKVITVYGDFHKNCMAPYKRKVAEDCDGDEDAFWSMMYSADYDQETEQDYKSGESIDRFHERPLRDYVYDNNYHGWM